MIEKRKLKEVVRRLSKSGKYGLDTETYGLKFEDQLFSIILHDGVGGYYFNFHPYDGGLNPELVLPRECIQELAPIFNNPDSTFFISDAKFDAMMLRKESIDIKGHLFCTQSMGRLARPTLGHDSNYSLGNLSEKWIGQKKDSSVEDYINTHRVFEVEEDRLRKKTFKNKHFWKVPPEMIERYGIQDAKLHLRLGLHEELMLKQSKFNTKGAPTIWHVVANERKLTKTLVKMEFQGISLDTEYCKKAYDYEMNMASEARASFHKHTGKIFTDSAKFLLGLLEPLGIKPGKTKKGNESYDSEALLKSEHPLAQAVLNVREHEKLATTYYAGFLGQVDFDGKMRANARQAGTITGRFSYRDPNLQNLPKQASKADKNIPFHVRRAFIPDDGYCFVSIDYRQMELRLMLDIAGEDKLIKAINNGEDPHQATADATGLDRKDAKAINFGLIYGMGVPLLAKQLGVSQDKARKYKAAYFKALPKVERFIEQVKRRGKVKGYVYNWMGRRNFIDDPSDCYKLPNFLIQGGCGDIMKRAMNDIYQIIDWDMCRMLIQVHDELLFEVHPDAFDMIPKITEAMEASYKPQNNMRMEVSMEHSWKSWGAADQVPGAPSARE